MAAHHTWTEDEDRILFSRYHDHTISLNDLAVLISVSKQQLLRRARYHNLAARPAVGAESLEPFSEEEDHAILNHLKEYDPADIAALFGRSVNSLRMRCKRLGTTFSQPWSEEEDGFMKTYADVLTPQEMAQSLVRYVRSVEARLGKLNLRFRYMDSLKPRRAHESPWTPQDRLVLKRNVYQLTTRELGVLLGRSDDSIEFQLKELRKAERATKKASAL